jgi:hypothetical protein
MSSVVRILEIMNLGEGKMPRTAPISTDVLLKVIQYTISKYNDDVSFKNLSAQNSFLDEVYTDLKLVGIKNITENEVDDYVFTFIKDNAELLDSGNFNSEEYIIPQKKKFEWYGVEKYWAWTADYYTGEIEAYSEVFVQNLFDEYELSVSDGQFIENEVYDTKDTEQEVDSIREIPFNKSVNENEEVKTDLETYESPFTAEEFMDYVESEWDLEMLDLMTGIIEKRRNFLKMVLDKANPRTYIKGFKRFDESRRRKK